VIDCSEPGAWAFHCHILPHAEGRDGMYGMVTALVVQAPAAAAASVVSASPVRAAAAAAGSTALECRIL
jgi:Multicopper oxidase